MAEAKHTTMSEKPEDPARRGLLLGLPAAAAAVAATGAVALDAGEPGPITGEQVDDLPFLMPIFGEPGIIALCVPASDIRHAYTYVLSSGRTILAERLDRVRCDDGSGWRDAAPGEFDGRIIGRVVTMMERRPGGWSEARAWIGGAA